MGHLYHLVAGHTWGGPTGFWTGVVFVVVIVFDTLKRKFRRHRAPSPVDGKAVYHLKDE